MKLPTFAEERLLWKKGLSYIAGIDEVGRGAWAGPVVAAAVVFPAFSQNLKPTKPFIRDSKQLPSHQREQLDEFIRNNCLDFSISAVSVKTINREGIVKATQRAFRKCIKSLKGRPDYILIDAFYIKNLPKKKQKPIIKGDQKSISIAAASIIAKVFRDKLMTDLHKIEPNYSFDRHKGYGTKIHQETIKKYGLSSLHRLEFIPENLINSKNK